MIQQDRALEPGIRVMSPAKGAGRGARTVSVPRGCLCPAGAPRGQQNLPGDPFHPHPHPQLAVPGWALCGKQEKSHSGASRGVLPVPGWALCWAPVASAFPGPDLSGADQGRSITACTTSLAALMRFLSLASCFIYVLQSLLCELAFFLPSWTKAQFVSRPSCQSRDCPVSQERRHNSTIPLYQGKTRAAFERLKPTGQQNARGRCTGSIMLPGKFLQF